MSRLLGDGWFEKYAIYVRQAEMLFWISALIVFLASPDFIIIPALRLYGITGLRLFILGSLAGTLELLFWFFFWRLLIKLIHLKKLENQPEDQAGEAKKLGWFGRVKKFFIRRYELAVDEHNLVMKFLKYGGRTALFIVAASPEPFGRLAGVIFCSLTRSWRAFIAVAIGNIIHTASVVYGWGVFFRFMHGWLV